MIPSMHSNFPHMELLPFAVDFPKREFVILYLYTILYFSVKMCLPSGGDVFLARLNTLSILSDLRQENTFSKCVSYKLKEYFRICLHLFKVRCH